MSLGPRGTFFSLSFPITAPLHFHLILLVVFLVSSSLSYLLTCSFHISLHLEWWSLSVHHMEDSHIISTIYLTDIGLEILSLRRSSRYREFWVALALGLVSTRYRHHPWGSFVHVQGMCICIYVKKKKMKRKEKISTCVYAHSILDNWVCILIFEGHVYRVCLLLRVRKWALWDPMLFVFALSYLIESEMSDLLLRTLGHCPFYYYIHCWCDFTSCLIWVDHHSFLYVHCFTLILTIAFDSFPSLHPLILLLQWPIPSLLFSLHHFCTSHYHLSPHWYYIHIGHS